MSAAQKLPETDAHFVAVEMPKPQPYVIAMTDDEFRLIENNIDGLRPLIHDAAETMDFIALMLSYNTTSEDSPGVMAALRLAARGLKAQATPEFEALDTL
tara:strand:- start:17 stop:316 length:300 start_codon:yes stop_codon:yes gene_type:complete